MLFWYIRGKITSLDKSLPAPQYTFPGKALTDNLIQKHLPFEAPTDNLIQIHLPLWGSNWQPHPNTPPLVRLKLTTSSKFTSPGKARIDNIIKIYPPPPCEALTDNLINILLPLWGSSYQPHHLIQIHLPLLGSNWQPHPNTPPLESPELKTSSKYTSPGKSRTDNFIPRFIVNVTRKFS